MGCGSLAGVTAWMHADRELLEQIAASDAEVAHADEHLVPTAKHGFHDPSPFKHRESFPARWGDGPMAVRVLQICTGNKINE